MFVLCYWRLLSNYKLENARLWLWQCCSVSSKTRRKMWMRKAKVFHPFTVCWNLWIRMTDFYGAISFEKRISTSSHQFVLHSQAKKKSMRTTNSTCINMNWWNALPHFQFSIHRMFFVEANRMLWLSFVNYLLATKKTSTGQTSERLSIYFILISKVCSMFESLDFGARVCANECTAKSRLTSSKENSERNDNTILLECDHLIASSFDLFVVHVSSAHRYASRRRVYRSIVYVHLRWKDTKGLRRCSKARSWCEWMLTLSANRIGLSELCMLKIVDLVISRLTLTRNWCVLSALTTTNDSSVQFWRWLQSVFICGVRHWVRSGIIYSGLNMLYQPKIGVNRSKS